MELALNAAPAHLRDGAAVWVLDSTGYVKARDGRYFLRRGDEVCIFAEHPAEEMPDDLAPLVRTTSLADLIAPRDDYFAHSDLSAYSVFEEALYHGRRAAAAIVRQRRSASALRQTSRRIA